ncbi:inosine/xanthosine triphosphatase [Caldivirga sp. UBA161]|uniref:inosine/xanthosine triphosphatase n=1 Tax=Caldivirga sp. UBA161 TaxID=1915569 RepID=UPI0025B84377|nr:inosine/xanthosine triphosphatase [Caldivirga sp. UBA161]
MKVALASRNPSKVKAVEEALRILNINGIVESVDPPPGLPPEPMGLEAIVNGAVIRARHALNSIKGSTYGIGIEAGVVTLNSLNVNLDATVAVVIDRGGLITLGLSPAFMIPPAFMKELMAGKELNNVVEEYYGVPNAGKGIGFIGLLSQGLTKRINLNTEAVYMALLPRMPWNKDLYGVSE